MDTTPTTPQGPPRVLVVYHSVEGQTARVAEHIGDVLAAGGAEVRVATVDEVDGPDGYDGVVLGDSIHAGRHSRALTRWIVQHADALDDGPVALFQVSLTSATDDDEHAAEALGYVQRLLDATGLHPDMVGMFAGALAYTRYGWLKRRFMRTIVAKDGGDTDTSTDHEYTDWEAVEHFATDALALIVAERRGSDRLVEGHGG